MPAVRNSLRKAMQETGNHHAVIVHGMVVPLMLSPLNGELVRLKHDMQDY